MISYNYDGYILKLKHGRDIIATPVKEDVSFFWLFELISKFGFEKVQNSSIRFNLKSVNGNDIIECIHKFNDGTTFLSKHGDQPNTTIKEVMEWLSIYLDEPIKEVEEWKK